MEGGLVGGVKGEGICLKQKYRKYKKTIYFKIPNGVSVEGR